MSIRDVSPDDWHDAVTAARATHPHFDWLDCVDEIGRSATLRVTLCLRDAANGELLVETGVDRDAARLASIGDVLPGALWSERELADLFGLTFVGGDPRPLLLPPAFGAHPLRKDQVAVARVTQTWPGAKDPADADARTPSRRRMAPPGVPDPAVFGTGEPDAAPPDPAVIAAGVDGGRRTRRSR